MPLKLNKCTQANQISSRYILSYVESIIQTGRKDIIRNQDDMINEFLSKILGNIKTNTITFKYFNSIHSDLSDQIDIELSKIIILLVIKNKIKINSNNNNIITLVN